MRFIYTKGFAIFAFCLSLVVLLMFLQSRGFLNTVKNIFLQVPRPVTYVFKSVTQPVNRFFYSVYHLREIARENSDLHGQLLQLQQTAVNIDQLRNENAVLRNELGFAKSSKQQLVPCTVLSSTVFGFSDLISLNCGSESGVAEGMAIVSQGYLVGKVIYTAKNSSTARLVTSSNFVADGKISKTDTAVQVEGSFGSGIVIDKLSQSDPLEKGWLVVTAGINDKIPKNILIGQVGVVLSSNNDLFKKSTLVSPVDFNNLDFVFAVKQ